jgi:hypothetical protein
MIEIVGINVVLVLAIFRALVEARRRAGPYNLLESIVFAQTHSKKQKDIRGQLNSQSLI